jgi:hypothetical protein
MDDGAEGTQIMAATFGRAQSRWLTEKYTVRQEFVEDLVERFGAKPDLDAFATAEDRRFPRWWGSGSSEATDAFSKPWGGGLLLWMNPPTVGWGTS